MQLKNLAKAAIKI